MAFSVIPASELPDTYNVSELGSRGQAAAFLTAFLASTDAESAVVSYSASNVASLKKALKDANTPESAVKIETLWNPAGTVSYPVTRELKDGTSKTFTVTREKRLTFGVKLVKIG